MKTGSIISFSSQKKYGFIKSGDGESYFFHVSDLKNSNKSNPEKGNLVSLEEKPTPKGMAAKNISIENSYTIYEPYDGDIIISKSESCGKGNQVVLNLKSITVENKNPNDAIDALKSKANRAGCNALLNFNRDRRTGVSWGNSNYKYTIHKFSADIALVKKVSNTSDLTLAEENKISLEREISRIKDDKLPSDDSVIDAGPFHFVVGVFVFIIFVLFIMR